MLYFLSIPTWLPCEFLQWKQEAYYLKQGQETWSSSSNHLLKMKNVRSYIATFPYAFIAWRWIKQEENFTLNYRAYISNDKDCFVKLGFKTDNNKIIT